MLILPTPARRNVVLDIETISLDPLDSKGALSALAGRIVCICMLFDDGVEVELSRRAHDPNLPAQRSA